MSEMNVRSIEIEQEIELWLVIDRHPKGGNRKNYLRTILKLAKTNIGNIGNNGWQLWQIRASYGLANAKQIRASLGPAAQQLRASLGLAANEQIQEPEALGKERGCRDGNITRQSNCCFISYHFHV